MGMRPIFTRPPFPLGGLHRHRPRDKKSHSKHQTIDIVSTFLLFWGSGNETSYKNVVTRDAIQLGIQVCGQFHPMQMVYVMY